MNDLHAAILLAEYVMAGVVSLIITMLWKKGPNYWPAGRLIAVAAGVPWIYRGYRRIQHWGHPDETVLYAVNNPSNLIYVYGFVLCLLLWVVALQVKTNGLPASRSVTLAGKDELEDRDTAIFHLRAAARLLKHRVIAVDDWERVMQEEVGWVDRLQQQIAELKGRGSLPRRGHE